MKDFIKFFFASILAILTLGVMTVCSVFAIGAVAESSDTDIKIKDKTVLVFNMDINITEQSPDDDPFSDLASQFSGQESPKSISMTNIIKALDKAQEDDRISALYIKGNLTGAGPAVLKEIREALIRFKTKKPIYAFNSGWSKSDLMLVAAATRLYLDPMGVIEMNGFAAEPMFYGDALKKYGIDIQVTRVGKYKSAVEPFTTNKMSEASREQTAKLLTDIWSEWKLAISADRKIQLDQIQTIADEKGFLFAGEAKSLGMIDEIKEDNDVLSELKVLSGKKESDKTFNQISLQRYLKADEDDATPRSSENRIAVVFAEGTIVDGNGSIGEIGGESLSRQLRRLRSDSSVKAVVLRVNSPGGSAYASELIQRELVLIQKDKPVVVSMGYVAASGGYWISTYANRIFAQPNTITGSIGVFGLFPNIKGLGNSVGITWDEVKTAELAAMQTTSRPKTSAELARYQLGVDKIYDDFIKMVAEGRRLKPEFVNEIAQGRVWSGKEAIKLGLVDELGGLSQAIDHAALIAKLGDDYQIEYAKPPLGTVERILKFLREDDPIAYGKMSVLGRQIRNQFSWLNSLNDPNGIYARMPYDLNIK